MSSDQQSIRISAECLYEEWQGWVTGTQVSLAFRRAVFCPWISPKIYISTCFEKSEDDFWLLWKKAKSGNSAECLLCSKLFQRRRASRGRSGTHPLPPGPHSAPGHRAIPALICVCTHLCFVLVYSVHVSAVNLSDLTSWVWERSESLPCKLTVTASFLAYFSFQKVSRERSLLDRGQPARTFTFSGLLPASQSGRTDFRSPGNRRAFGSSVSDHQVALSAVPGSTVAPKTRLCPDPWNLLILPDGTRALSWLTLVDLKCSHISQERSTRRRRTWKDRQRLEPRGPKPRNTHSHQNLDTRKTASPGASRQGAANPWISDSGPAEPRE